MSICELSRICREMVPSLFWGDDPGRKPGHHPDGFKGVQLAIDDFGTGNTSLSWLEKLRPDVLKIDRSFTSSVGIDSVNATVTDIIIALANRLHIVTVAEGVETLEQESYLRSHGVDVLQGFYYARPMPVEAFPAWLASREESEGESETTE